MSKIKSICVYCGSSPGHNPIYKQAGKALGKSIAEHGLELIYGGGTKGIMGAVADGVMSAGGKVTGIIPKFLMNKEATEHALGQLNELIITEDMHERKHKMFQRSDAFVTLPGGIGTVEEIVEIMTWAQLGRHHKPMVFANINDFWSPMLALIDHMKSEGFVHTSHLVKPLVVSKAEDIVPTILANAPSSKLDIDGIDQVIEKM